MTLSMAVSQRSPSRLATLFERKGRTTGASVLAVIARTSSGKLRADTFGLHDRGSTAEAAGGRCGQLLREREMDHLEMPGKGRKYSCLR